MGTHNRNESPTNQPRGVTVVNGTRAPIVKIRDSSAVPSAAIARVSDALRSFGLTPAPRDADLDDIIFACTDGLAELARRHKVFIENELRAQSVNKAPMPARGRSPSPSSRQPVQIHDPSLLERLQAKENEATELRKSVLQMKNSIKALEHQIRVKDSDLERIQSQLKTTVEDASKRSALAMGTLREQKLGSNAYAAISSYQRQNDALQKDNENLSRKVQSLTARLRSLLEAPAQQVSGDAKLVDELHATQDECNTLSCRVEEQQNDIDSLTAQVRQWESKAYELKEELLHLKKAKDRGKRVKDLISSEAGNTTCEPEDAILVEVCRKFKVDEISVLPRVVDLVTSLLGSICRDLGDLALGLPPYSGEALEALHSRVLETITAQRTLEEIDALLGQPTEGTVAVLRSLLDELAFYRHDQGENPIVRQICDIVKSDPSTVVSVVHALQFKLEELQNFYTSIVAELRLRKGCSYAECLRNLRTVRGAAEPDIGQYIDILKPSHVRHSSSSDHSSSSESSIIVRGQSHRR